MASARACGPTIPITLKLEPPAGGWRAALRDGRDTPRRAAVAELIHRHADAMGTGRLNTRQPLTATGHQAWLWHPGILAKDIMASELARGGGAWLHLVVDQDVHEALTLDLPSRAGERLEVRTLRLAPMRPDVPTGMQPPAEAGDVLAVLRGSGDPRLATLIEAWTDLPHVRTLAEQIAVVTVRLMRAWTGDVTLLMVSQLAGLPVFEELVAAMLEDARSCVTHYNAAVRANPQAGVGLLAVERQRVELPLWVLEWERPRRRVFADLADAQAVLTTEDGRPVDRAGQTLAPRALLLTALMRDGLCDLFIHGAGGCAYDRVTEAWLSDWLGVRLAPKALVTATMTLDFDREAATERDLAQAKWVAHHLPFNLDRFLDDPGPRRQREAALREIEALPRRSEARRHAFERMRAMQRDLARRHERILDEAQRTVRLTARRLSERALMNDRAWAFPLHPPAALAELRGRIAEGFARGV